MIIDCLHPNKLFLIDYFCRSAVLILAFVFSLICSSILIRFGIPLLKPYTSQIPDSTKISRKKVNWWSDIGFWIGFFETLIIFVFVVNKEFSGLALIFGAKEFVRKEEIIKDPAYYLLGTIINLGISLVVIEIALDILSIMHL